MDYWRVGERGDDIIIACFAHDKQQQWTAAIAAFSELMVRGARARRVIVDLRQMTGYETEARRAWQEAFRGHRHQMLGVVCVGGSRRIKMGAAVVGAVSGVPMRFVDEWEQPAGP